MDTIVHYYNLGFSYLENFYRSSGNFPHILVLIGMFYLLWYAVEAYWIFWRYTSRLGM